MENWNIIQGSISFLKSTQKFQKSNQNPSLKPVCKWINQNNFYAYVNNRKSSNGQCLNNGTKVQIILQDDS